VRKFESAVPELHEQKPVLEDFAIAIELAEEFKP
jgi:hypothetical protein